MSRIMSSLCDYSMYFPSTPTSNLTDPTEYTKFPRRRHVCLGEVNVQFLLVLRFRDSGGDSWKEQVGSMFALTSVCVGESRKRRVAECPSESPSSSIEEESGEENGENAEPCRMSEGRTRIFSQCLPLLIHNSSVYEGRRSRTQSVKASVVSDDQVIFSLTVSFDKLPVNTLKAKVIVTVWTQDEEKVEVREHGYLTLLQLRSPTHTFRQDLKTFKAQVHTTLDVLPPPTVYCQQMTVSGNHFTVLKVVNHSSKEEVCIKEVRILPNYNSSFLPMMPDGSVLIVDNVCHKSSEITMASFYRMDSKSSHLPSTLSALEKQNFLFKLQLQNKAEEDSSEGLEIPLVAVLQWYTPGLPLTSLISSCYSLPSVHLSRPQLVMTASCPRAVRPLEPFWVKYTLLNDLQDFLCVRLIWNSDAQRQNNRLSMVLCQSPVNNLGQCRKGSILTFCVAFQILTTGLFELSQHMKLKLQFTASMSTPPPAHLPPQSPEKRSPSPSPVARELLDRQSAGRSHSFSHQPSVKTPVRLSSVIGCPAVTPPVVPLVGRTRYPSSDHNIITADKIAKRECKVLVLKHDAGEVIAKRHTEKLLKPPRA